MRYLTVLLAFMGLLVSDVAGGQTFSVPVTVSDGTLTRVLTLGVHPAGTDGFDSGLDALLPPAPPAGEFDARLRWNNEDYFTDIRSNTLDRKTFKMHYQAGVGAGPITLSWNPTALPYPDRVEFMIFDDITGMLNSLDMRSTGSLDVSTSSFFADKLQIQVDLRPEATATVNSGQTGQVFSAEGVIVEITANSSPTAGMLAATRFEGRAPLNNDAVTGGAVTAPDGFPLTVDTVSPDRFWYLSAQGLSNITYKVCLDVTDLPGAGVHDRLVVVKRSDGTQPWTPYNTTLETPGGAPHVCADGLTSFSQFGLGSNTQNNPLPVELVLFEAVLDGDAASLQWETASETNNAGFEVQRISKKDGASPLWEEEGFVDGAGTTLEAQYYRYRVETLEPGRHVFRLKQIDYDGAFEYSPEVEVTVDIPGAYYLSSAYPNPFNPQTQFTLAVARSQHVRVEVFDVMGRRVALLHDGVLPADDAWRFTLEAGPLPSGVYVYRATGAFFQGAKHVVLLR